MKRGSVVIATAGKEKGGKYVVVYLDDKFVYIADGKRLKKDKPKKKSLKHVQECLTSPLETEILDDTNFRVNSAIKKFIKGKE